MAQLIVRNPYTGAELAREEYASGEKIARALETATRALQRWRTSSAHARAELLKRVAAEMGARKDEFASTLCQEAGKPIRLAQAEVERALGVLEWAAGEAQRFGGELLRLDAGAGGRPGFGIHTRFPRGVVLGITPFNFPLNLVVHKVAPAVACGCPIVIKPSPATPLSALKLASLFEAHEPGLVQVVLADDAATAALTRAREIATISFTGSARVGWAIRKQAPEKPTTLELGGNAWVIVMQNVPESRYPAIAHRICGGAFGYAGQSCISIQNVAVAHEAWSGFREALAAATQETVFGDPEDPAVVSGPLIRDDAAERVRAQIKAAPPGAEWIQSTRGAAGASPSTVVPPSLALLGEMGGAASGSPLVQEELFGPVMSAVSFRSLEELIAQVNSSRYGLQAGVFTQEWPVIERLYRELEVGGLVVNDAPTTRYDHQPYGGVKDSGQGREGVRYAMDEMTESKFLALSSTLPA